MLPPPLYLRQIDAGARRGRWGLLWAYVRRIGWHARRLPSGLRDLRTARRRS
ncbi:hypothetical protein NKG94_45515 [Micromonospora sp. M12]